MRRRFILGAIMALSLTLSACALFGGRADDAGTKAGGGAPAPRAGATMVGGALSVRPMNPTVTVAPPS